MIWGQKAARKLRTLALAEDQKVWFAELTWYLTTIFNSRESDAFFRLQWVPGTYVVQTYMQENTHVPNVKNNNSGLGSM